jgi:uncharacterized repeat protein (TIGR03803 family)
MKKLIKKTPCGIKYSLLKSIDELLNKGLYSKIIAIPCLSFLLCFSSLGDTYAQYTKLHDFDSDNGMGPTGDLISSGSVLYGMTHDGGLPSSNGVIFSMNNDGTNYQKLYNFSSSSGALPFGSLIISGSELYGMTSQGGTQALGTIFKINTDGSSYQVLLDCDAASGGISRGSLIISGSVLYGLANAGGTNSVGLIFKINTDGTGFQDLFDFNGTNGSNPLGTPFLSGSVLYGMTSVGGTTDNGVIFRINTDGTGFQVLHNFNDTDGNSPRGSLTLYGSTLYGMTPLGGSNNAGVIFKINTDGTGFQDIYNFNGITSSSPLGSLTLIGSSLYGMTNGGGTLGVGVIFKINTDGSGYTNILEFGLTNSAYPEGSLILSNTLLYGMSQQGGPFNYGTIFSFQLPSVWDGASWSAGSPGNTSSVEITGPYIIGVSDGGADLNVANLTLSGGGSLTIDPGKTLTVSGTLTIGSSATINGNISTSALLITPTGNITLNPGSILNASGNITISSDASGDGSLINNGNLSGNAVVERYLPNASWHLVSASVASANNSVYTGLYMKQYNEAADTFGPFVSATNVTLTPGTGVVLWANSSNTVAYNGTLNNGPVGPLTCTHNLNGYNLMGNPYPSSIDWNAASGWTKTNLSGTIWMWTQSAGQYASWNGTTATNGGTRYLAMGQGFFVQALAGGGSLSMTKEVQVHNGVTLLKSAKVTPQLLRARITGNNYADEVVIMQADDAQDAIDYRYDAQKMMGLAEAPQLYTIKENKMFSIASIKTIDTTTQIPLNLIVGADAVYTLSLENSLQIAGLKLFLHDNKLNITNEVTENFSYNCQVSPTDVSDRFVLEFRSAAVGVSIPDKSLSKILVWSAGQDLFVNVPIGETLTKIEVYDLSGRKLFDRNSLSGKSLDLNLPAALYIVRVSSDKQISNHKIVIR